MNGGELVIVNDESTQVHMDEPSLSNGSEEEEKQQLVTDRTVNNDEDDDDTSVEGYFMKDVMIPPNSSLKALSAGEKLILAPSNQLYLIASDNESYDAVISYVDIV